MRVLLAALIGVAASLAVGRTAAAQTVTFGTDWRAEAEHGGYYQALATGIYKKYGLDVKLEQGGPQVNHSELLAAGSISTSPRIPSSRSISSSRTSRWSRSPRCFRRILRC